MPGALAFLDLMTVATKDDETAIVDSLPAPAATIAISGNDRHKMTARRADGRKAIAGFADHE